MTNLVLVEHDNAALKSATLHVIPAAQKIGGEIHLLVAGQNCRAVADEAAKIPGLAKVLLADDAAYANRLAENLVMALAVIRCPFGRDGETMTVSYRLGSPATSRTNIVGDMSQ